MWLELDCNDCDHEYAVDVVVVVLVVVYHPLNYCYWNNNDHHCEPDPSVASGDW